MDKPISQHEQVKQLCNNVLYVLQHSYYKGEHAHLVELSKQFMNELKKDVESRMEAEAKTATEEANKPGVKDPAYVNSAALEA